MVIDRHVVRELCMLWHRGDEFAAAIYSNELEHNVQMVVGELPVPNFDVASELLTCMIVQPHRRYALAVFTGVRGYHSIQEVRIQNGRTLQFLLFSRILLFSTRKC